MGGLDLSELTVSGKFIDSFSGKLLSGSRVRIPFAGLENPALQVSITEPPPTETKPSKPPSAANPAPALNDRSVGSTSTAS